MKREFKSALVELRRGNIKAIPAKVTDYFLRRTPKIKNLVDKRKTHLKIEALLLKNKGKKALFENISVIYILNNIDDPKLLIKSIHSLKLQVKNPHVIFIDLSNNPEEVYSIIQNYLPKSQKYTVEQNTRLSEILKSIYKIHDLRDYVLFCDEDAKFNSLTNLVDKVKFNEDELYCADFIYYRKTLKEYFIGRKNINFYENLNHFCAYYPIIPKNSLALENTDLIDFLKRDFRVIPAIFSVKELNRDFHKNNVFFRYFERKYETTKLETIDDIYNYRFDFNAKVSIIIPTRDQIALLKQCLESIEKSTYKNFEIIIIDHLSNEESQVYLKTLRHKVVRYEEEFNFAKINNFGVQQATGDVICFLNNDTELITEDWMQTLGSFAMRGDVGAVGPKLLFKNNLIQHAGVKVAKDLSSASHILTYEKDNFITKELNTITSPDAVTGACLFIEKRKFLEVYGFDEILKVTWQDIDLCFKLKERGYKTLFVPYTKLYHYESKTRKVHPSDNEKKEAQHFLSKWKG
jgi:GT2 family glycosyltransferase